MAQPSDHEFEQAIDRLYALPLDEFTAGRNALVKEARDAGQRAIASRIKELRKPSVSAWAVNRLARERELDLQRLLRAGEKLGAAQREAVAGRDPEAFSAARRDEQEALTRLGKAARELLEREGHGVGALDRVLQTMRAAATTDEGRELLKQGRLTADLEPQGFEALAGIRPAPRKPVGARKSSAADHSARKREIAESRRRLRELKHEERALAREADAARREAAQAERRARELAGSADKALAAAREAARVVAEAETALEKLNRAPAPRA